MFDLTLLDKLIDHTPSPEYTNANTLVEPGGRSRMRAAGATMPWPVILRKGRGRTAAGGFLLLKVRNFGRRLKQKSSRDLGPQPAQTPILLSSPTSKKSSPNWGLIFTTPFPTCIKKSSMPKPITILPLASGWGPKSRLLFCFNRRPKFILERVCGQLAYPEGLSRTCLVHSISSLIVPILYRHLK